MVDGEELNEGVQGFGGKLCVVEARTRKQVGERAEGGFDLRDGRGVPYHIF